MYRKGRIQWDYLFKQILAFYFLEGHANKWIQLSIQELLLLLLQRLSDNPKRTHTHKTYFRDFAVFI